jgi:hypothetical protein
MSHKAHNKHKKRLNQDKSNLSNFQPNFSSKDLRSLNITKNRELEFSGTVDSARNSETTQKSQRSYILEFCEAAGNGNRDKLQAFLHSGKILNINS